MIFYWALFYLVVFLIFLLVFQEINLIHIFENSETLRVGVFWVLLVFLSLFVGFFSKSGSVDYDNYVDLLSENVPANRYELLTLKDPFFQLIGFILRNSDGSLIALTFVTAFLSIWIKLKVFSNKYYKNLFGVAVLFLFSRFFLLHEFTQMRAALGIAFISIAVLYALEEKPSLMLLMVALAGLTHLSTVALLPVILFAYKTSLRLKQIFVVVLLVVALALALVFDVENFSRISPYLTGEYYVTENTLLSFYFMIKIFVVAALSFKWRLLNPGLRCALAATVYGMLLTLVFLQNDVLSLRLSELTAVFDCICFAYFFKHVLNINYLHGYYFAFILAGFFFFSATNVVKPLSLIF